ncbi:hypothetical protein ASPCAL02015 [Aspergillus calidoustus]|uniref:CCHC-type domain-containing protein n=1 Tax=Aspergillus calidoustus TaxID=454130 RepID=A0A0U5GMF3_ASPCI|nr:hypothetical protein ASPCAL02015 [Aspergillus calidoustus]
MAFWAEPKACSNCGLMQAGHTRKNCPVIKCFRCHEQGHISDDCPNTKCSYCRRMGHCKAECPKLKLKKSKGHKAPPHSPPTGQKTGINSWELVPNVVFPTLHSTISQLASRLVADSDVYLQRLPYRSVITRLGGPQKVAQMLLEWVDPQIKTRPRNLHTCRRGSSRTMGKKQRLVLVLVVEALLLATKPERNSYRAANISELGREETISLL